jgi:hypothetical protein
VAGEFTPVESSWIRAADDLIRSQPIGEIGLLADERFRF